MPATRCSSGAMVWSRPWYDSNRSGSWLSGARSGRAVWLFAPTATSRQPAPSTRPGRYSCHSARMTAPEGQALGSTHRPGRDREDREGDEKEEPTLGQVHEPLAQRGAHEVD